MGNKPISITLGQKKEDIETKRLEKIVQIQTYVLLSDAEKTADRLKLTYIEVLEYIIKHKQLPEKA